MKTALIILGLESIAITAALANHNSTVGLVILTSLFLLSVAVIFYILRIKK